VATPCTRDTRHASLARLRHTPASRAAAARQNGRVTSPTSSDALLQLIFDHAGEGISVFDAQMTLRAWNDRFIAFTGLDPSMVRKGVPLRELLQAMARAGEFGPCHIEAEVERRLIDLRDSPPSITQRTRPDGRVLELRRNPTPGGGFVMLYADITERRAAEATVADQQRMLTLLLEQTEQGFWFIDNDLRTTDANPAMCRILGLSLDALRGRDIYAFVDEENAEIFRQHVRLRAQGLADGYEITLSRPDGRRVFCYNHATPIFDAMGRKTGAVGMFSDISRLKQAELQIRQTGQLLAEKTRVLEMTLESLSQGVLSVDAEGRINTWNRRVLELLEVPESVLQTRPTFESLRWYQVRHGLLGEQTAEPIARPALYQRRRHDGRVLEVQTHSAADGSIVRTYTDVTERVAAAEALRESETRFRTMADGAPALIWQSDAQGNAVWFNQRWLQYTGQTMENELARDWRHRMHADDIDRCRAAFEAAAGGHSAYSVEFRLMCADGGHRWIADHGIPRFSADWRFEGFIAYGWDITERKAVEAALIAARDEAERANRAKSEFLSRMSHELRTPLNAVLGFGQLLERDPAHPLDTVQSARVQDLLRGGRHLLYLINEVLDLARIEAGALQLQLRPVDLAEVAGECLSLVQPLAGDGAIDLRCDSTAPCTVQADPTRLKQVLLNLLSNAVKYNRPGGQVRVSWRAEDSGKVRIEVQDTGRGLSPAQQERLFQAFERLDAEEGDVEGAGIGLALSKWLVDLMQGEIGVCSSVGAGSTFWVRLNAAEAAVDAAPVAVSATPSGAGVHPAAPPMAPDATALRGTVLYIEDNAVNQLLMEGVLSHRPGLRLLIAGLPEVGLTMAAQARPDLVLLDIQLPGMDGFEVLRRLREQPATREVPVIAVSANAMQSDIDAALRAGFDSYITKPLDMQRMLALVDEKLRR